MKELKASTKQGQRVVEMGNRCVAGNLREIYGTYSAEKQEHYDRCLRLCYEDNGTQFGVARCGSWSFTASWYCKKEHNGKIERVMRVETRESHYLVWLES